MSPTIGPAVITLFGVDIPIMATALSIVGLILARVVAPPPLRKLSRWQEVCLTLLLLLIMFLLVTGELSACSMKNLLVDTECTQVPLGTGLATVWGIGLGFSGLLAIEFFGNRFSAAFKAMFGEKTP